MESNKSTCKICREIKTRIHDGYFNESKTVKRHVDESGSSWNGRVCPECHKERIKAGMRTLRHARRAS